MERVGIIDLGSDSIRLVIIDIKENRAHHQIENLQETARLLSTAGPGGELSHQAIDFAVETIALFTKFCAARHVGQILAVATAAVRRAPNRQELTQRIQERTGIILKVLSGEEEAYLGYLGLINNVTERDGLMVDLGGGALKLVGFKERLNTDSVCLDFGSISLMERFDLAHQPAAENLREFEQFLEKNLSRIPWLFDYPNLIGIGGTLRTLARIYRNHVGYVPDITDGILIPTEAVGEIYHLLSRQSLAERSRIPGLEESRADLSVSGAGIAYQLLRIVGKPHLQVSVGSIRDGLFFEHLYPRDPILFNVLIHHTNNLIGYYNLDEDHLRRVSILAVTLFDGLQSLHNLGSFERRLLLIASLLHELGVVISIESLEKHTLYTILNSPLRGLTQRERVLIAFLAASHDQLFQHNLVDYANRGPLSLDDILLVKKLAPLLQIAHSLDRSRTGVVTHLQAELTDEICTLKVFGNQKRDLEIRDASRRAEAFQMEYGPKLKIKAG